MGFSTDAIHGGQAPEDESGAVVPPLHLSTTFARRSVDSHTRYTYARRNNPTRENLETLLATLEEGKDAIAFSSGMAAITAIFSMFKTGNHFVVTDNVYGGTREVLQGICEHNGSEVTFVDSSNLLALRQAVTDQTKLIFIETPTNPLLKISDISSIADIALEREIMLCVDNSAMTPYLQKPLELGAHMVIHSTSKYFSGHNDSIGGAVITGNPEISAELRRIQGINGAILSPFDCWLLARGTKTLALRMDRHSENGYLIAEYLHNHELVNQVYYPGLPSHPNHELAKRQCRGFGGVVSFDFRKQSLAVGFLNNLKLFRLAVSTGSVESLACHPFSMTLGYLSPGEKERLGISPNLVRLSAGVEDVEDLIEDIDNAFAKIG